MAMLQSWQDTLMTTDDWADEIVETNLETHEVMQQEERPATDWISDEVNRNM